MKNIVEYNIFLFCLFMNSLMIFLAYTFIFIYIIVFRIYERVCMGGTFDRLHAGDTFKNKNINILFFERLTVLSNMKKVGSSIFFVSCRCVSEHKK